MPAGTGFVFTLLVCAGNQDANGNESIIGSGRAENIPVNVSYLVDV